MNEQLLLKLTIRTLTHRWEFYKLNVHVVSNTKQIQATIYFGELHGDKLYDMQL